MKKTAIVSILSFIFHFNPSLASAGELTGRFSGDCILEGSQSVTAHSFDLGPNSKAVVGTDGIKVQVLNNLTHPSMQYFDVLAIGVSLDRRNATDIPRLCPRAPEERRRECLEENRRNFPPFVPAPQDGFKLIENNGSVEAATHRREIIGKDPIRVTLMKLAVTSIDELEDGMELSGSFELNNVKVSCTGRFLKQ